MRLIINKLFMRSAIPSICVLLASGCSKKSTNTPNAQFTAQTNQIKETANPIPAFVQPIQTASNTGSIVQVDGQPDMAELNRVARLWMYNNHRRPTSWEDFAAHAGVQIPPPPPGKKYAISRSMRVTLVDR
jgi:hypothetical protein